MSARGHCASRIQTAGLFSFPWLTAGFQDTHDLASPSPLERVQVGLESPAQPWLPELLPALVSQVSLGCSCVWGLEVPSCIGVLLLAGSVFPSRPGGHYPFKTKLTVSWSAGAAFWDDCLPALALVTCSCLY